MHKFYVMQEGRNDPMDSNDLRLFGTKMLTDTLQQLSLVRDIGEVMQIVKTVARKIAGAEGATFVLRDGDKCYYADEDAISPLWKGSRFPMSACISGWVMLNRKPVIIGDIYSDERIPIDAYRPTFVKSLVMVPIRTMDPLGAIGSYWANHHQPTAEEVSMLQALADITAVSIENIEVRNTLEDKVTERTQELLESIDREKELNELKSTFVSMASHEFRTPLSSILLSAALAERYAESGQQDLLDKHFSRIRSSVDNLTGILNDFLSLDKLQQGKVETLTEKFNLADFLQETIREVDGMNKKGQEIRYLHSGGKHVFCDKKILRNIMLNLLSNAIKYSEKQIVLSSEVTEGVVIIRVTDRGIGIPEGQQKDLFTKFFRANNVNSVQGTGLGLYIVKRYIDLLNGTIHLESTTNEGSTFTINFPAAMEE